MTKQLPASDLTAHLQWKPRTPIPLAEKELMASNTIDRILDSPLRSGDTICEHVNWPGIPFTKDKELATTNLWTCALAANKRSVLADNAVGKIIWFYRISAETEGLIIKTEQFMNRNKAILAHNNLYFLLAKHAADYRDGPTLLSSLETKLRRENGLMVHWREIDGQDPEEWLYYPEDNALYAILKYKLHDDKNSVIDAIKKSEIYLNGLLINKVKRITTSDFDYYNSYNNALWIYALAITGHIDEARDAIEKMKHSPANLCMGNSLVMNEMKINGQIQGAETLPKNNAMWVIALNAAGLWAEAEDTIEAIKKSEMYVPELGLLSRNNRIVSGNTEHTLDGPGNALWAIALSGKGL